MNAFYKWADRSVKKMTVRDVGMVKIVLLLTGMIIGAFISSFVKQNVYFFIAAILLLWTILGLKFYRK